MINKNLYQVYYIYNKIGKILAKKFRLAILLKSNRPALERCSAHDRLPVLIVVVVVVVILKVIVAVVVVVLFFSFGS